MMDESERQIMKWLQEEAAKYDAMLVGHIAIILRGLAYRITSGEHRKANHD